MKSIRIVIADDNLLIRDSLKTLLSLENDIIILGEAENGEDAVRLVEQLAPDILLLDLQMPGMDGFEVTSRLMAAGSAVIILILSAQGDPEYIRCMLSLGASGYVLKEEAAEILLKAIREVAAGRGGWLSPLVERKLKESSQLPHHL